MTRKYFLTIVSLIATGVGMFALFFPVALQKSKGTSPNNATYVWTSEVGVLLIAIGIMAFLVRKEENSKTLRVFLFGNAIIQIGLLVIELLACVNGVITKLSGVIPNLSLHILLTTGFLYFLVLMNKEYNQQRKLS